jgi:hypothetical protein
MIAGANAKRRTPAPDQPPSGASSASRVVSGSPIALGQPQWA